MAIPTVRVLRSESGADEELDEAGTLLGCDTLQSQEKVCVQREQNKEEL